MGGRAAAGAVRTVRAAPRVLLVAPGPGLVRAAVEAGLDTWVVRDPRLRPPEFCRPAGLPSARLLPADFGDAEALREALAGRVRTLGIEHVLHPTNGFAPGRAGEAAAVTVATVLRELGLFQASEPVTFPASALPRARTAAPGSPRVQVETLTLHGMHLLAQITADAPPAELPAEVPVLRAAVRALLDSAGHESGAARTDLVLAADGPRVLAVGPPGGSALRHRIW
jgi:hypothetical protein